MLQQTQVETMLPYYRRFLRVFPTVRHLARVRVEEVLKLWSGLGYYSRARNLHRAAQRIAARGNFPQTKNDWLELPGIGEYTAGAIASIAFGEPVPVVDGNVIRVLTRVFTLTGDPGKNPLKGKLWRLAASLVPKDAPGDFNQALMELGALVCLPKEPHCLVCPLKKMCKARQLNAVESFPTPKKKAPTQKVLIETSLIKKNGCFLLACRNNQRHLQSMWEFPQVAPKELQVTAKKLGKLPTVRHSIMNRSIRLLPSVWQFVRGNPKPSHCYVAYHWIKPEELKNFPTSSLNQKVLKVFQREEA